MKTIRIVITVVAVLAFAAGRANGSKQVIGSFPSMDGGFEDQAEGPPVIVSSTVAEQTQWTAQNAGLGATNYAAGGRSGPSYMELWHTGATHYRLQSPTSTGIETGMPHVVQFYYKTLSSFVRGAIRTAVSPSGTSSVGFYTPYFFTNQVAEWTKFSAVYYTVTSAGAGNGMAVISVNSNVQFMIDDFAVYPGTEIDAAAPDAPTAFVSNNITISSVDLSWTAPGSGVDGGGYLVARGTVDPATPPAVNGLYAEGNAIDPDATVVYIGTATSFTDSNLVQNTLYRYRIYTADKAFNYSAPLAGSARTLPEPAAAAAFLAIFALRSRKSA